MKRQALLKTMTLEEKVMQLCALYDNQIQEDGDLSDRLLRERAGRGIGCVMSLARDKKARAGAEAVNGVQRFLVEQTRLGIPALMVEECLHGLMAREATIFPQSLGMAASWDPEGYGRVARAIARETRARGVALALSPTINIARDPRCGRTEETYGEDMLLTRRMALAFVKNMQANGVGCTPKHFAANFVGDGGRDSMDIHFSERELREVYLPAFEACVKEAKCMAIMPAYNTMDGIPCSAHPWLLIKVLREEWGFEGITGSDFHAIDGMLLRQFTARDGSECARKALLNGMDVEWPNSHMYPTLIEQVKTGKVPIKAVDRSVERVLHVKERLGLLREPYARMRRVIELTGSREQRDLACEAARRTMVLLKNKGVLPFSGKLGKLAVIGPNADTVRTGGYSATQTPVVTPLAALRRRLGADRVLYARGCANTGGSRAGIKRAVKAARAADAAVIVAGNWPGGSWKSEPMTEGEGRDRCSLALPGHQEELIREVARVNRRTVVVLVTGGVVIMENWIEDVKAVLHAWYPGCEGGTALAEVLFGDVNPGGKLPLTFPRREGQLPCFYNIKPTGRHYDYVDLRGDQFRFPFGHGLSYTRFEYGALRIEKSGDRRGGVTVRCTVTNTGRRTGDEVVQLYVHDVYNAIVTRPLMELKGFERLTLKPGESRRIAFRLTRRDLSFPGPNFKPMFDPGEFEIMVGASSADIRLRRTVEID
jgi:beta-glucosidase